MRRRRRVQRRPRKQDQAQAGDRPGGLRPGPVSFRLVTDPDLSADANPDPNSDPARAPDADANLDPNADPTPPRPPRPTGPIQYKGEELDAQRGPGLGCFRFQLIVLAVLIVLTPLSVVWGWPDVVSAALLFIVILLLLLTGQTIIFLLRLVAADRRGRPRPLASATRTVGELEDEAGREEPPPDDKPESADEPRA